MDFPLSPLALLLLFVYVVHWAYRSITRKPTALDTLPWVGLPKGPFAKLRARFNITDKRDVFASSWRQYSSQGKAFLFPSFLGGPMIVLPASSMQWVANQPESNLSVHEQLRSSMSFDLTLLDRSVLEHPIHESVIRGELTRTLGATLEPIREELLQSLDANWGTGTEWHEICLWESLTKIVARASNRVFVGTDVCRKEEYINSAVGFAIAVIVSGTLIRPIPAFLRPILGWPFLYGIKRYYNTAAKHLIPIIEERKAKIAKAQQDETFKYDEPFDVLQWNIHNSLKDSDPRQWDAHLIAKRCMATNLAAIHTTSIMGTNILFDIASSPPEQGVLASLREEASRVFNESGQVWTKNSLTKLVRLDSVVREGMRLGALGAFSLNRRVTAKGGLVTEDGITLPEGSLVAVHAYGSQMMDGIYENAAQWEPFRFSDARESPKEHENNATGYTKGPRMTGVTTGPAFLTFGHGKHACPGRFFAVQEIKLLVAQIILSFDIQHMNERPKNKWVGVGQTPPTKAMLTVRKLEKPVVAAPS